MGKLTIKLWNYVLKGKKFVYWIGYRYQQIFLIHYRLSEYRVNSVSVHHYTQWLQYAPLPCRMILQEIASIYLQVICKTARKLNGHFVARPCNKLAQILHTLQSLCKIMPHVQLLADLPRLLWSLARTFFLWILQGNSARNLQNPCTFLQDGSYIVRGLWLQWYSCCSSILCQRTSSH